MSGAATPVRTVVRRRWACKQDGCGQTRLTPVSTSFAPICQVHGGPMAKLRKVTRVRTARWWPR